MSAGRKTPECVIYACQILYGSSTELHRVPTDLVDRLTKVNDNCRRLSGEITSRQVVALIVADWQREELVKELKRKVYRVWGSPNQSNEGEKQ